MHEHRLLENLDKYPERRAVYEALQQLHKEGHPHLAQYVATVVGPSGMTLREAAAVLGVSYQRVAQLRDRGLRQISESGRLDLTWWPMLPPAPPRPVREAPIQQDVLFRLRKANVKAKAFRRGADPRAALAFYAAVARLHAVGVPYATIARALGEDERMFSRRLARWGVTEGRHGQVGLTVAAQKNAEKGARND